MDKFSTSLVRERITYTGTAVGENTISKKDDGTILSNRVLLELGFGPNVEKIAVRGQNMHITLRLAAKLLLSFQKNGPLLPRANALNWDSLLAIVLSDYEKEYNKEVWASVYANGQRLYRTKTSTFIDIIEKCALLSVDNYDGTMDVTEDALRQIGHDIVINHSSSVATIFTDTGEATRVGVIHRGTEKDTIFNFAVFGGERNERIVQAMGAASAYLELFSVRYTINDFQNKLRTGEVPKISPEQRQLRAAISRQASIIKAINKFEKEYEVKYRPFKPDVLTM